MSSVDPSVCLHKYIREDDGSGPEGSAWLGHLTIFFLNFGDPRNFGTGKANCTSMQLICW